MFQSTGIGAVAILALVGACGAPGEADDSQSTNALSAGECTRTQAAAFARELANANPNMDCTLVVPADPLSAEGLATPWRLQATNAASGPCLEANASQGAFVEATIYDPTAHALSIYHPLVVDEGKRPLAAPTKPTLPAGAIVGLWIGSNATFNRLQGADATTLADARCVSGLGSNAAASGQAYPTAQTAGASSSAQAFGQVSACNAAAFFAATQADISAGKLVPPALGKASDGLACPTTRDFFIVDQDQSDNVLTTYLSDACGDTAQTNATNAARFEGATTLANGSDNRLLSKVDAALGCSGWTVPDLTGGAADSSQALNELQATLQQAPVALVPLGDPMVLLGGEVDNQTATTSTTKMDLYRSIVGQEPDVLSDTTRYCQELLAIAAPRLAKNRAVLAKQPSLVPAVGNNLFTFLAARLMATFAPPDGAGAGLGPKGCTQLLRVANPVTVKTDANGVAIAATIATPSP